MKKSVSILLSVIIISICTITANSLTNSGEYDKTEKGNTLLAPEEIIDSKYNFSERGYAYSPDGVTFYRLEELGKLTSGAYLYYNDIGAKYPVSQRFEIGDYVFVEKGSQTGSGVEGLGLFVVKDNSAYDIVQACKNNIATADEIVKLISGQTEINFCFYIENKNDATAPKSDTPDVEKTANPIKVSAKLKTLKANKLKKKKQFAKPLVIKNAKGKVFVTKLKKGTTSDIYKRITVKKNGLITIKKGKYLRKTYKINLKITANGNAYYDAKTVTKTVRIRIK